MIKHDLKRQRRLIRQANEALHSARSRVKKFTYTAEQYLEEHERQRKMKTWQWKLKSWFRKWILLISGSQ